MGAREEGLPIEGAEDRFRLLDPPFGPRHLGGVAQAIVKGRLLGGKPRHGRQHPKGIGGEEDDAIRVSRLTGEDGVRDGLEGKGSATIFRVAAVVIVDVPGERVPGDVFHRCAMALGGRVNQRLILCGKANGFGVATPLEIMDPVVAPAVLVIPQEEAFRVHRHGRFPRA